MREEMGPLNQECIVTCHVAPHDLTPFISDQLYKTPSEERCVCSPRMQDMPGTAQPPVGCFCASRKGGPHFMAHGTLANLSTSAFIRTPPRFAEWIVHHLLTFPTGEAVTVLDPTAGEGDLLAPCRVYPAARLYGVEISADRADVARAAPAACHHPHQRLRGHQLHARLHEPGAG